MLMNEASLSNKFTTFALDIKTGKTHSVGAYLVLKEVTQVRKIKNYYGEELISLIVLMPLSYTSTTNQGWWNRDTQVDENIPFGSFVFSPAQYAVTSLTDSLKKYIFIGTQAGFTFSGIHKYLDVELVQKRQNDSDKPFK